jgi:hypothetical protein
MSPHATTNPHLLGRLSLRTALIVPYTVIITLTIAAVIWLSLRAPVPYK